MGNKGSKTAGNDKPNTPPQTSQPTSDKASDKQIAQDNRQIAQKPTRPTAVTTQKPENGVSINSSDIQLIQKAFTTIESMCKVSPNPDTIQAELDKLFAQVDPKAYIALVSSFQGVRHNVLQALLKAPSSPSFNDDHILKLVCRNEMLIPSCSPQYPLFQTLSLYLKRPHAPQHSLPLLECLLSRIESNTIDTLFSVYSTFDEYIQQCGGVHTEEQFTIIKLLLDWLNSRVKNIQIPVGYIAPPTFQDGTPYYLSIYHLHVLGAKLFHKVQVPPLFHLIKSPVDNIVFRSALEYIINAYGYDLYNPLVSKREVISEELLYPYHCLFHSPVVGASEQQKPLYRQVINLNNEIASPGVPQSRSGSTCSYLSQQSKIFSLDLLIYLIHLATKDQIRAIHRYHNSIPSAGVVGAPPAPGKKPLPLEMTDVELYKALMAATHNWLHLLSSSYGVPTLATALGNGLSLNEKIIYLQSSNTQGANAVTTFETFTEGTAKFIVSMINTYKQSTLLFDAKDRPAAAATKIKNEFEDKEEPEVTSLTYQSTVDMFSYNPLPLLLLVRYVVWLSRSAPDLVHQDCVQYLHLFMGQLIPSTFSYFASSALNKQREQLLIERQQLTAEKEQFDPTKTPIHPLLTTTQQNYVATIDPRVVAIDKTTDALANPNGFATMEDKHRLALSKYVKLWPVYEEALNAYISLDNSLPLYSETTLTISDLWFLVASYNYDDISSLQLLFNPFFMTMSFPQYFMGMSSQFLNLSDALLGLGFCQNVYVNPFTLVHDRAQYAQAHAKYPSLMMADSAFGGTNAPRFSIRILQQSSLSIKTASDTPSEFIPRGIFGNLLGSLMTQFPSVYSTPLPTSRPLSTAPLAYNVAQNLIDESSSLHQQLAFTRNVLETMCQNTLQQNISLYLYIINVMQLVFYQMSVSLNDTQHLLIKTQISVALNQIKNYVDKTGSLFLQLSAEDKPLTSFSNSLIPSSRQVQGPTVRVLERFSPPAAATQQFDIYSNPQRRQAFLQQQLPTILQTMLSLCSTGHIWSILSPNLTDVLSTEKGWFNYGEGLARCQHLYSLSLLTMFQSLCLQSYIVEQSESIITKPLKLSTPHTQTLTPAQQLTSVTLTYLCYLSPLSPNSFGTSLLSCFFRIADEFVEKLKFIVAQSAGNKSVQATISPVEYFCAVLCYQPVAYTMEKTAEHYTTSGAIPVSAEITETPADGTEKKEKKDKKESGVDAARLFGQSITFTWDTSAYDETLVGTPLPAINNPFLWLLYQSKFMDRLKYKKTHSHQSLEQYLQEHFHVTTYSQRTIAAFEAQHHEQPYLPSTAQLMYYLDYSIGSMTHFHQSNNHFSGFSTALQDGQDGAVNASKDQDLGCSNYYTKHPKFQCQFIHSTHIPIESTKPYEATGLLAFLLDVCYKPSIDEIFTLFQGVGMSELTMDFLRASDDPTAYGFADADDTTLHDFKIVQPIQFQFARFITSPVRPYTYNAFFPEHATFSDASLFSGVQPKHRDNLLKYFTQSFAANSPQQISSFDAVFDEGHVEYTASLSNEVIVSAILRRSDPSILMALVNQLGVDDLLQYSRPMYVFSQDQGKWVHSTWNIVDLMTAVGTNLYAPDFFNYVKSASQL